MKTLLSKSNCELLLHNSVTMQEHELMLDDKIKNDAVLFVRSDKDAALT